MSPRLVSTRVPFVPITVPVNEVSISVDALLDTGFEGDVLVPQSIAIAAGRPNGYVVLRLADGSAATGPVFVGAVEISSIGRFRAEIVALGDEYLIGLRFANRFSITLDHGRQLIIEP